MTVEDFCIAISALNLSQSQQALAILWFVDNSQPGTSRTPGELTRLLRDSGLGNSHSTRLGEAVVKSGHALRTGERLRIKPTSCAAVEKWISSVITPKLPSADQANGFIPEAIWLGTRGYVETIARQINGCYEFGFFDGAMVLLRDWSRR